MPQFTRGMSSCANNKKTSSILVGLEAVFWVVEPLESHAFLSVNANFEKVGIIDRGNYRQRKILMFYYEVGTDNTEGEV